MKKLSAIALVLFLTISLAACGGSGNGGTSTPDTTAPSTGRPVMPSTNPTIDTNIPDPNVDTHMPMYTDGTQDTSGVGGSGSSNGSQGGSTGSGIGSGSGTGSGN